MRVAATTNLSDPKIMSWDTEFWGAPVANATHLDGLSEWAVANTVGLVCLLVDANDPQQAQKAEEAGFRFMDVRVTLRDRNLPCYMVSRPATFDDTELLCAIGRDAFPLTRFYADLSLDDERCDDLYEGWTRSLCEGGADMVLVSERDGHPVGFITINLGEDDSEIGLVAVADDYRGNGIGAELVRSASSWAHGQRRWMKVVTQGRNIGALRTFESCGFRIVKTELWFHKRYA